jgi:hypothetical protein
MPKNHLVLFIEKIQIQIQIQIVYFSMYAKLHLHIDKVIYH